MPSSSLAQQPDGLEVDVDDLEGIPNKAMARVGEYRGSWNRKQTKKANAHRPSPSPKSLHTAIAAGYQHSSPECECDRP